MQQAFAEHLISLRLENKIDNQELVSICSLTRLTTLQLEIAGTKLADGSAAAAAMTSLQNLRNLLLKGQSADSSLYQVDWSPLTQLTHLYLGRMRGSLRAASTIAGLQSLSLSQSRGVVATGQAASARLRMHSCLNSLSCCQMQWLHVAAALSCLTGLAALSCDNMWPNHLELLAGGPASVWQALGRLTTLTFLRIEGGVMIAEGR